ncbi:ThuA domain-containing protein [Abyssalbus ytuae]|uniref:ThuA domain-containing protein n=1 Tax=Abyssalbus ytuae TaxID=2926907 RepID=A0A9E7CSA5_9FLAO|nr:ThuA domain-containing protein [Abyssalbus ytuae]UOB15941.1 ThuA domain-containing protein [Abyssalbus ytuae]
MKYFLPLIFCVVLISCSSPNENVLVFTKTAGFRHESIETGVKLMKDLGAENNFTVYNTEDASVFHADSLAKFNLVIFLNTSGNILNKEQQNAFKSYINNGGSFMGIHGAADTENRWKWFTQLLGASFASHPKNPNVRQATINVLRTEHNSCRHLNYEWVRYDEWYNFSHISPNITVLMKLDESTYKGGRNGRNHPIAWYQEFEGGRSFYTGGGHTEQCYSEEAFVKHLLGGIEFCLRRESN